MQHSSIDTAQISEVDARNLSSTFLAAVMRYYEDPKHVQAFEEWQRKRNEQKAGSVEKIL